jgi:hypothetical protein
MLKVASAKWCAEYKIHGKEGSYLPKSATPAAPTYSATWGMKKSRETDALINMVVHASQNRRSYRYSVELDSTQSLLGSSRGKPEWILLATNPYRFVLWFLSE